MQISIMIFRTVEHPYYTGDVRLCNSTAIITYLFDTISCLRLEIHSAE